MNITQTVEMIGRKAAAAAGSLSILSSDQRNAALHAMADGLSAGKESVLAANEKDCTAGAASGLSNAMVDRLRLSDSRYQAMVDGIRYVALLPDPLGEILLNRQLENGILLQKRRVPIGVIGIIYESRPNVTVDASTLCLKAGNAVILKGGSEALHTNKALVDILQKCGVTAGLPLDALQLIELSDRQAVTALVQLEGLVDLIIPRGGEGLIRAVTAQARVPVIKHYKGVCHVYIEESANESMALTIVENAKCQRPGVCNAVETLLLDEAAAKRILPKLAELLFSRGVELRGDSRARQLVPAMNIASESDWSEEYLDLVLAVRVVDSLDQALEHIQTYGSKHSDAIITENQGAASRFVNCVDSAAVFVNASTRFHDGARFGLGAEIGISTDKLHARGPMGLEELTTYKWIVLGNGQIVQ